MILRVSTWGQNLVLELRVNCSTTLYEFSFMGRGTQPPAPAQVRGASEPDADALDPRLPVVFPSSISSQARRWRLSRYLQRQAAGFAP